MVRIVIYLVEYVNYKLYPIPVFGMRAEKRNNLYQFQQYL
jgi:hypothetical protein